MEIKRGRGASMGKKDISGEQLSNRISLACYTVLVTILMACYLLEVIKGARTISYYLYSVFCACISAGDSNIYNVLSE